MPNRTNRIKPAEYDQWLQAPAVARLLTLESDWIADALHTLHAQHLLYAGIDPHARKIHQRRIGHAFQMCLPWQSQQPAHAALMSDTHWPFADDSIDIVVLQHALEFARQPHQVMREATRTVVSNGYVIVVGFNPNSPWGLVRSAGSLSRQLPWSLSLLHAQRIADWLTLLDFRIESILPIGHLWPLKIGGDRMSRRIDRKLAGNHWLPASAYLLVARKRVAGVTPIRPWQWRSMLSSETLGYALTAPNENRTRGQ